MKIGVVSDVHANRPALEAVLDDMESVDRRVMAGDVVGMFGWNRWTVETIRDEFDDTVFGNHDARIRPDFAYTPSFKMAADEHKLVTEQLDEEHVEWVSNLPERIETDEYIVAHSRPFYFRDPGYPYHGYAQGDGGISPGEFTKIGPHLDGKTAFLGHTHDQHAVDVSKFEGQTGMVVNPGSTGVPWYKDAKYAVVDTEERTFDLRRVEYEYERIEERLEELGYPVGSYGQQRLNRSNQTVR